MLELPDHFAEKLVSQLVLFSPFVHTHKCQMQLFWITILQCSLKYLQNSILNKKERKEKETPKFYWNNTDDKKDY